MKIVRIKVIWTHENVHAEKTDYDMHDKWTVHVVQEDGTLSSWATIVTPFDEINFRTHDWRVRKAARLIAKRLRVPGVTKRLLRPMLREAMFHRDELVTFER